MIKSNRRREETRGGEREERSRRRKRGRRVKMELHVGGSVEAEEERKREARGEEWRNYRVKSGNGREIKKSKGEIERE